VGILGIQALLGAVFLSILRLNRLGATATESMRASG
jgi:hypothetical protein